MVQRPPWYLRIFIPVLVKSILVLILVLDHAYQKIAIECLQETTNCIRIHDNCIGQLTNTKLTGPGVGEYGGVLDVETIANAIVVTRIPDTNMNIHILELQYYSGVDNCSSRYSCPWRCNYSLQEHYYWQCTNGGGQMEPDLHNDIL